MNRQSFRPESFIKAITAIGITCLAAALLAGAPAVSEGIKKGLAVSAGILAPSLFPFMALSGFISMTDYGRILSLPLGGITERLFKLPRELGFVILLSMIGGYPVGAKIISSLLERKRIGVATAERMLCFCVNAGPSFLITAVGTGMFLDRKAGLILFGTQIAATILVGAIFSARAYREEVKVKAPPETGMVPAFVLSVTGAASSMISLCAFAVLFSGLLALAEWTGLTGVVAGWLGIGRVLPDTILSGLFEVTAGCVAAARLGGSLGFGLASVFLSFGGISVIFQVVSFFGGHPVKLGRFFLSRLTHMICSTAMALPLYGVFCGSKPAWFPSQPPPMLTDDKTIWISLCLLGMCAALTLSMGEQKKR